MSARDSARRGCERRQASATRRPRRTECFRDRVVSMEQTLEGGEKNLDLLKAALPGGLAGLRVPRALARPRARPLRDVARGARRAAQDGRLDADGPLRCGADSRARRPTPRHGCDAGSSTSCAPARPGPEIVVTFRHLEDGWEDTPEARRGTPPPPEGRAAETKTGTPSRDGSPAASGERPRGRTGRRPAPRRDRPGPRARPAPPRRREPPTARSGRPGLGGQPPRPLGAPGAARRRVARPGGDAPAADPRRHAAPS